MQRIEFGIDGIRGLVGTWPWHKPVIMRIGQALGEFVHSKVNSGCAVIGRDTRASGVGFLSDLCTGLMGQGVNVINLGIMTTPGVAFLTKRFHAELGVIISASHSSLEYNGIKLIGANGLRLQREEEIIIESLINDFVETQPRFHETFGQETNGDHLGDIYIDDHVTRCPISTLKGFRVVLDCAHGATSKLAPKIFERLGADVTVINGSINGDNINYHAGSEYVRDYPQELVAKLHETGANYGFAFDGDGDRLVVVDNSGRIFDGKDLLYILALHYKKLNYLNNDTVVTTRLSNRGFEESLLKHGIKVTYVDKGDKNLESAMWGGNFMLGGEIGGNLFINDGHHTAADAVYTSLIIASTTIDNKGISLRSIADQLEKHPQRIVSFPVIGSLSKQQIDKIESKIDALRKKMGSDSRLMFWESTTEHNIYRVLAEGGSLNSQEEIEEAALAGKQIIEQVAAELKITTLSHSLE